MSSNALSLFVGSMAAQAPVLIVYACGFVVAAVMLRRYPRPAVLTLAGTLLLLVVTAVFSLAQAYLLEARAVAGRSPVDTGWLLSGLGFLSSCLRAAGVGLILIAVFAGRRPETLEEV